MKLPAISTFPDQIEHTDTTLNGRTDQKEHMVTSPAMSRMEDCTPVGHAQTGTGRGVFTDLCHGLMWSRKTCGAGMDWYAALDWVNRQNALHHCGFSDWRLPNSCELASLEGGHLALLGEQVPVIETRKLNCEPGSTPACSGKLRSAPTRNGLSDFVAPSGVHAVTTDEPALRSSVEVGGGSRATSAAYLESHPQTSQVTRIFRFVPMVRTPKHRA